MDIEFENKYEKLQALHPFSMIKEESKINHSEQSIMNSDQQSSVLINEIL